MLFLLFPTKAVGCLIFFFLSLHTDVALAILYATDSIVIWDFNCCRLKFFYVIYSVYIFYFFNISLFN